ncbi:MAG: hypothetical protein AB8B83_06455 [Bdellovibrionales bacterium]
MAAETPNFVDKSVFKNQSLITNLSSLDFEQISPFDFNEDSLNEYILMDSDQGVFNKYTIIGYHNKRIVQLAEINAARIMISHEMVDGVRSVLGFRNLNNDFDYDLYNWNAPQSRFISNKSDGLGGKK